MGMLQEFKEFAMKGNLIDMAVGVVMGGAFGNVVSISEVPEHLKRAILAAEDDRFYEHGGVDYLGVS